MDMRLAAAACLAGLSLAACAPVQSSRPDVPPLQLADCASLYPHPDSIPEPAADAPFASPAALAEEGAARLALARFRGCQQDDAVRQNQHLAALGRQLQYDRDQHLAELAAWQSRDAAAKAARDRYQAECSQPGLPDAQYQSCLQRSQDLNTEIAAVNSDDATLLQHNDELNARIQAYEQQAGAGAGPVQAAYVGYAAALKSEGAWLDQARYLVNSSRYQAAAATAACPGVMTSPQSIDAMHELATALIACLKRLPAVP